VLEVERQVELPLLHVAEPSRQPRLALEMPPVHKEPRGRTGTAVQVFVGAPEGEIHVVVVEVVRHGPHGMGAVEADHDSPLVGGSRKPPQVQK
jgi:hypothetical protein